MVFSLKLEILVYLVSVFVLMILGVVCCVVVLVVIVLVLFL